MGRRKEAQVAPAGSGLCTAVLQGARENSEVGPEGSREWGPEQVGNACEEEGPQL